MTATVDEFGEPIPTLNQLVTEDTPTPPKRGKKAAVQNTNNSPGFEPEQANDAMGYLRNISQGNNVRVAISRVAPRYWKNRSIVGLLDTSTEFVEESEIKERWGGGKYAVKVSIQDKSGKWKFAGQRTIDISGPPNEEALETVVGSPVSNAPQEDAGIVRQAMQTVTDIAEEERSRNDRLVDELRRGNSQPSEAIRIMQENNRLMLELSEKRMASLEKQLLAAQTKETSPQDKVIEKLLLDDQGRINSLREMHASELRSMRENHLAEMKRIEDRSDRTIEDLRRSHEREIDNLRSSHAMAIESLKAGSESKFMILQSENKRLESEVAELKQDLKELRATKDKSPTETMMEMAQLKEAMESVMGGGGDKEEGSTFSKIAEQVPGIIGGIMQQRQAAATQAQAAQSTAPMPSPVPAAPIVSKGVAQVKKVSKPKPAAPKEAVNKEDGVVTLNIDPAQVAGAVAFMEQAVLNETPPEEFANSVQSLVPPEVLQQIFAVGIDKWLDNVAKLSPGSALNDQRGRNFVKQVAKLLRG